MFVLAIVVAVIALAVVGISFAMPPRKEGELPIRRILRGAAGALGGFAVLLTVFASFFTQDVGQSSVLRDWTGNVAGEVSDSGLHTKAPWQDVVTFDVRNQRVVFLDPKNSTGDNSGGASDGREIAVTDKDGVTSNVDVTVRYNLDPGKVTGIYRNFKDEDKLKSTLIYNDIRSVVRSEAGKVSTLSLLTQRDRLAQSIRTRLDDRWRDQGVLIDEVALQQIDAPKTVQEAYATAQKSQIEVQKAQNDLAATKVSAQQQVVQAQAAADANNLLSASLTPQVLQQKYLDALKSGTVYVVPAGSTPFISAPK